HRLSSSPTPRPAFFGRCENRRYAVARRLRPSSPLLSGSPRPACSLRVASSLSGEDWETRSLRLRDRAFPCARQEDAPPATDAWVQEPSMPSTSEGRNVGRRRPDVLGSDGQ